MNFNKYLYLERNKPKNSNFLTIDNFRTLTSNNEIDIFRDNVLNKTGLVKNQDDLIEESNKLKEENEYFKKLYSISKEKYPNEPEIVFSDLIYKYKKKNYNPPKLKGNVNIFNPNPLIMENEHIQNYYDYYRRYTLKNTDFIRNDKYLELAEKEKILLEKKMTLFHSKKTNEINKKANNGGNSVSRFRWRKDDFVSPQSSKNTILISDDSKISSYRGKFDKNKIKQLKKDIQITKELLNTININDKPKEIPIENIINLRRKSLMKPESTIKLSPNVSFRNDIRFEKRLNTTSTNSTGKSFHEMINSYKNENYNIKSIKNDDSFKNFTSNQFVTALKNTNQRINKMKLNKKRFSINKKFLRNASNIKKATSHFTKNNLSDRKKKKTPSIVYNELINEEDKLKFSNIILENDMRKFSNNQFENIFTVYCKKFLKCDEDKIDDFLKKNENLKNEDFLKVLNIFDRDRKFKNFLDLQRKSGGYKKLDEINLKAKDFEKLSIKKRNMLLIAE